jgi:DNA-binding transcriptional regulator YiaG
MSLWHHNEGAVRLMTWLLFKTKVNQTSPLTVEMLMNVAFGTSLIEAAKASSNERKKLLRRWETALRVLLERGWNIKHDPDTYPLQYWPALLDTEPLAQIPDNPEEAAQFWSEDADLSPGGRLTDLTRRTRHSFEQLLSGKLWILPPADIAGKLDEIDECKKKKRKKDLAKKQSAPSQDYSALTGQQLKDQRISLGLSQRDLSTLTGISQKMISLLENGERRLSETNRERLLKVFRN